MPILPAEPDLYPEDLWRRIESGLEEGKRWWCLHALPRQEKSAARHMRSKFLSYYLPLVVQEGRTPGGRKTRSQVPLFPGYLFLLGDDHERVEAVKGNNLANVLEVVDQSKLGEGFDSGSSDADFGAASDV